jgi:hypothetical protein
LAGSATGVSFEPWEDTGAVPGVVLQPVKAIAAEMVTARAKGVSLFMIALIVSVR